MHVLRFGNKLNEEVCRGFIFLIHYLYVRLGWSILIANLVTNSQDLVAIVKYLVALAPTSGTISRPVFGSNINVHVILLFHPRDPPDHLAHQENRFDAIYSIYCSSCCTYQPLPSLTCFRPLAISEDASCVPRIRNSLRLPKLNYNGRNNNVEARRIAIYTLLIHMTQKKITENPKSTSSCLFLADLP